MNPTRSKSQLIGYLLLLFMVLTTSVCTDADVDAIMPYYNDKLSIKGDFCSTDPADIVYTTRVLFLIDCSDSMQWNDPNGSRADAIRNVVELYREVESVLFGIIRFGETVEMETETFTKDEEEINNALAPIQDPTDPKQYLGGSDFIAVLADAVNFILKDRVVGTHDQDVTYLIVFITDGAPQAGTFDPATTVQKIIEKVWALRGMGVRFHTVMLSAEMMGVPPEFLDILETMAAAGGGEYRELGGAFTVEAILKDLLDLSGVLRIFDLKSFIAYNQNAVFLEHQGELNMFVDSDGDGLADFMEDQMGTSLTSSDTDGDGISDLIEARVGSDPLAKEMHGLDPDAPEFNDDDNDWLNNYEESLLGTGEQLFDSDADGIPDGLEIRFNTDPLTIDERGDYDEDYLPNLDEIRAHTNPRLEDTDFQEEFGYRYNVEKVGRNKGTICYRFRVDNITLRTPLASENQESGRNKIHLIVVDSPMDNPELMGHHAEANLGIIYRAPSYRDPNALTMFLNSEGFE